MSEPIDENEEMSIEDAIEVVVMALNGRKYEELTPYEKDVIKRLDKGLDLKVKINGKFLNEGN